MVTSRSKTDPIGPKSEGLGDVCAALDPAIMDHLHLINVYGKNHHDGGRFKIWVFFLLTSGPTTSRIAGSTSIVAGLVEGEGGW
jgi:hypothetical protein